MKRIERRFKRILENTSSCKKSQKYLKNIITYDSDCSHFTWNETGDILEVKDMQGFKVVKIDTIEYHYEAILSIYLNCKFKKPLLFINTHGLLVGKNKEVKKEKEKAKIELNQRNLKKAFFYDKKTGFFYKKENFILCKCSFGSNQNGYLSINFNGKRYLSHILAWLYVKGEMPKLGIDHKDGDRSNNAIKNLRLSTQQQNCQNQIKAQKRNLTGFLGVHVGASKDRKNKFIASIGVDKKVIYLGCYPTPEEAHEAYKSVKREVHEFCTI